MRFSKKRSENEMKGIVIFFSLKEKNRAKETIVDEKGTILVQI